MHLLKNTFRLWWQKPRNINDLEEERSISFLELFYDLAYVGIIFQLTHALIAHLGTTELLIYIALYTMTWFAWVNGTLYHELHGNNDVRTRIFTFLQMLALAFMGIFAPSAFGHGAAGFSIAYAAFLAIITFLWWRTGVHDHLHKPLSQPYAIGFLGTTGIFILSIFAVPPATYYFWAAALVFSLLLPIILIHTVRNKVDAKHLEQAQRIRPALAERFGLLTIIVLGEAVASIMRGAAHHEHISGLLVIYVLLGTLLAVSMWWLYFDLVARRLPIQKTSTQLSWTYVHLPITMSIALVAAGLLYVLEHPDYITTLGQWLIVGPAVTFLLSLVVLNRTLQIRPENQEVHRTAKLTALLSTAVIFCIGFLNLEILWLLVWVNVLLLVPVFSAFRVWVKRHYQAQNNGQISQGI